MHPGTHPTTRDWPMYPQFDPNVDAALKRDFMDELLVMRYVPCCAHWYMYRGVYAHQHLTVLIGICGKACIHARECTVRASVPVCVVWCVGPVIIGTRFRWMCVWLRSYGVLPALCLPLHGVHTWRAHHCLSPPPRMWTLHTCDPPPSHIDHPNIVKLHGACAKPPRMCFVMELCHRSVFQLLHMQRKERISQKYRLRILVRRCVVCIHQCIYIYIRMNVYMMHTHTPSLSSAGHGTRDAVPALAQPPHCPPGHQVTQCTA